MASDNEAIVTLDEVKEKRKIDRFRARALELHGLLREEKPEWEKVYPYMCMPEPLNPNQKDMFSGVTTMHMAAYSGEVEIIRWCVRMKGDLDARSGVGRTPLHYACGCGQTRSVRCLLEEEADANVRTLSHLTPLHLCCQENNYECVLLLLHETQQVVDIDAEDTRRRTPESLTTSKMIKRAIRKYRQSFDDKVHAALLDAALTRLFRLFDWNGDDFVYPEEWAETMSLVASHFENHDQDAMDEVFNNADKNHDGRIELKEFKNAHADLINALGVPFKDVMNAVTDIEQGIFREKVRLEQNAAEAEKCKSPVVSAWAKKLMTERHLSFGLPEAATQKEEQKAEEGKPEEEKPEEEAPQESGGDDPSVGAAVAAEAATQKEEQKAEEGKPEEEKPEEEAPQESGGDDPSVGAAVAAEAPEVE
eukprot:TRINITY_DN2376_c0_g1_i2.p1 TRINITY_DN2376_c0_g1~~TRINITY_DN2376_c0_g1_i2.p1  ORF type:complete len:421 (-),score=117.03 TRINITY_DN2376_c0_g1_i2:175-1437(-)